MLSTYLNAVLRAGLVRGVRRAAIGSGYQHATRDGDAVIAEALNEIIGRSSVTA
jgi:hypothetical protein